MLTQLVSPSLADLSEVQYLLKYAKYLGPSWFRRVLTSLVPSPTVQRLKKAVDDVEDGLEFGVGFGGGRFEVEGDRKEDME